MATVSRNHKLVLVGQAPSRSGDPTRPLAGGPVGKKLAALFGATLDEYVERTERHNLLGKWPGRAGKGDCFPMSRAKQAAGVLCEALGGRDVIFVGKNVAAAFGIRKATYLSWALFCDEASGASFEAAVVPHPSGINRWWNDPKNRRAARAFMRRAWRSQNPKPSRSR